METTVNRCKATHHNSTDPTYKEWKLPENSIMVRHRRARILPTRNGNLLDSLMLRAGRLARILPTRNGNHKTRIHNHLYEVGTDPTYKEWKRVTPARHGTKPPKEHGSYLQGMETEMAKKVLKY